MQTLRVHPERRHLTTEDGSRLYLIGDTAWELFHALDREEAAWYLRTRQAQGYNMIQAVVLAELNGLETPNACGRLPLRKNTEGFWDPAMPDTDGEYSYFDHVEYIVSLAEELGIYIGMLPTWGDKYNRMWGVGPEIFTEENARVYGRFLGETFRHHNNILWILGGDRPLQTEEHHRIVDAMAYGLKEGDGGKFLMTFHPCGASSSSAFVHGRDWLDFHMMQSGHGYPSPWCFDMMAADFGETCYEVPVGFKYISAGIDAHDAVLGGESSGGLTVRGHIHGKDSIYAASLFVEMISAVEKSPSEIMDALEQKYGHFEMVEDNITFTFEQKSTVNRIIFEEKKIPFFGKPVTRVNYEDGCKVYFADGSFVICRFSGTEPLLRIFAEASDAATAKGYIEAFRDLLALE